ncbi:MAG: hypothetical protein ABNH26_01230 [Celeribacter sp.]
MIFAPPRDEYALLGPDGRPLIALQLVLRALAGESRASFTQGDQWSLHWRQPDRRLRQLRAVVDRAHFVTPGRGHVEFCAGLHRLIWTPGTLMAHIDPLARPELALM